MFPQLPDHVNYPDLEKDILRFWKEANIFERSVETRPADKNWTFYDGPPTVNGVPGIHHVLSRTLKDMFCRYQTMRGYRVHRRAGWDTHGLPVEIALEKMLGLKEKGEIETKVGIGEFNRLAKEFVYDNIQKVGGWQALTERTGYWVNMDDPYITCSNNYIESVWWALSEFFRKGLIYRGYKVVPQCPHCETPLSSHELAQGYEDVQDPSLFVKVNVQDGQCAGDVALPDNSFFLVWTTTPWTLISNVALSVGADIEYTIAREPESGEHYIFATALGEKLDPDTQWERVATVKGSALEKTHYHRLFSYVPVDTDAFYVTLGDFVSVEDGTGIVHLAPAFGQDDYEVSRKYGLPILQPVTPGGRFTDVVTDYAGRTVKTLVFDDKTEEGVDKEIVIALKERGLVLKYAKNYLHSYPHCWRCHNPLIYYARDSWFISTTQYSEQMIAENNTIRWQPPEVGSGRFGNWLQENKDWSLSRDRYWGTPLCIWVNEEDRDDMFAVGSIAQLMEGEFEQQDGTFVPVKDIEDQIDLHKHFVDHVVFRKDRKTYRRTHELIDVWFDSASMPFAQWHYPFENKEEFERHFPADFICEGIDQTRGWFYTLHAVATGLFGKPAMRSVLVNDLVLDDKGKKMSKSSGNIINPFEIIDKYGADATRWYMITISPPWTPMSFKEKELAQTVLADFFRALTNTYNFFALYANIDGFTYKQDAIPMEERTELDRWILSVLNTTIGEYTEYMETYDPRRAMRLVHQFTIEQLSNWYVRRNRRRFWKGELSDDKVAAYQTLYECLNAVCKLMAPLAPFLSEHLFRSLNGISGLEELESVHLAYIPESDAALIDAALERRMERAQKAVALARMLREKSSLKVRQPLRRVLIAVADETEQQDYQLVDHIIRDELNVKAVEYVGANESSEVVRKKAKPNFKAIGPKYGKLAKAAAASITSITNEQIAELQRSGSLTISSGSDTFVFLPEDIEIQHEDIEGWLVASEGATTVALDTELDEELENEGLAREFVNRVQNLRKDSGFDVTDRISIRYSTEEHLARALQAQQKYIMQETLATEFVHATEGNSTEFDINGVICGIALGRMEQTPV